MKEQEFYRRGYTGNKKNYVLKCLGMVIQFGIMILVPVAACSFLGIFIADKTGYPVLMVPFFFLGALSGLKSVYDFAMKLSKSNSDKDGLDVKHDKKI